MWLILCFPLCNYTKHSFHFWARNIWSKLLRLPCLAPPPLPFYKKLNEVDFWIFTKQFTIKESQAKLFWSPILDSIEKRLELGFSFNSNSLTHIPCWVFFCVWFYFYGRLVEKRYGSFISKVYLEARYIYYWVRIILIILEFKCSILIYSYQGK